MESFWAQVNGGERDVAVIIYACNTHVGNLAGCVCVFVVWRLARCDGGNLEDAHCCVLIYSHSSASAMRLLAVGDALESPDVNRLIAPAFRKDQSASLSEHSVFLKVMNMRVQRLDVKSGEVEVLSVIVAPHEGASLV